MKRLLAMGLACCLPTGLAAEDPSEPDFLPATVNVLVMEDSAPVAVNDVLCARSPSDRRATECMTVNRAVLTARMQKVSLRERSRWM